MGKLTVPESVKLSIVEKAAFEEFQRSNKHYMSSDTAANFFAMFREGYSLTEMLKVNPAWGLGALVDARIRYEWDLRLKQYIEDSHRQAYERVDKVKTEAINYVMDQLTIVHAISREEVMKYLANPIEANRPKKSRVSAHEYKEMLDALDKAMKIGATASQPPPAQQPSVAVIAGPGSTVAVGSGDPVGAAMVKLAEEARRVKFQEK